MRHELSFLEDILSACRKIEAIVAATSEDSFLVDHVLTAAVRHRIVHAYFDLDWQILWAAATDEIPELRERVLRILATEDVRRQ
jgi:uncharacterized protein with HEPN domain